MAFDLSNAANILKTRYLGPIREQLNNATVLLNRIQRDTESVSGKSFTVPLHTGRNNASGIGRADGGVLPTAGQQDYHVAVIPNAYNYGRIQITGPTIRAARDNAGAFVRAVESEISGLTRDFKRSINRQLLGDGTGALAYIAASYDTNSASQTVDDNQGNAFVHLPTGAITVDIHDASTLATKNGNSVSATLGAKSTTTYACTVGTTTTSCSDGDIICLEDTMGYEMLGIDGIIATTDTYVTTAAAYDDLHGIDASTHPFWQSQVFTNSGTQRDLTLALMQDPLTAISVNSDYSEDDVKFLLSNYFMRDQYYQLLVQEKRFVNQLSLDGGWTGLAFSGRPLICDPQCKRNSIFYLVPDALRIYMTSDFDWMDKDGAQLSRVSGYDAYEAIMFYYANLGTTARNALGELGDIND